MSKYTNHSGGAQGADMTWEVVGVEYGVATNAYGFRGHTNHSYNPVVLNTEQLLEGWEHVNEAEKTLGRNIKRIEFNPYVRNLICRNWYQIKNSTTVFAVGKFKKRYLEVDGGTGWAVQMAMDNDRTIYFFDQENKQWTIWNSHVKQFHPITYTPTLTEDFAGIGTRAINDDGIQAIINVYKETFRHE